MYPRHVPNVVYIIEQIGLLLDIITLATLNCYLHPLLPVHEIRITRSISLPRLLYPNE